MKKCLMVLFVPGVFAAFGGMNFSGFVGAKERTLLEGRAFSNYARTDVMDEAVNAFATHRDDATENGKRHGWWQGEYWGKTMLGHTGAARLTGRADAREYVRAQVKRLVEGYMREDGYLGTYGESGYVRKTWNLWGRKYTLWGLVEAYEVTGDRQALAAAEKTMDQIIAMLGKMKLPVRETGCFNGLPTGSILSPLVRLYRHVKKDPYLAFMREIVADWDRADGAPPNLIANAFSGKPVHAWYPEPVVWAKSYEMMSCYEGLVDYAELTGEKRGLAAAEKAADLLAEHEGNALGAVGYYDHFTHAAANDNATIEMCDVVYWMRLCHALYRATGNWRHLERAERAFCNAFLAGLYRDGDWGAYSVRAHGTRHGTACLQIGMRHHCCCVDNSPRGFYDMADHAVCVRHGRVEVNYYFPGEAQLEGGGRVKIGGNYPIAGDVTLEVTVPKACGLALRVPAWCGAFTLDGNVRQAENGRVWIRTQGTRTYRLGFDMPVRLVRRGNVGTAALAAGDGSDGKGHDGQRFLYELSRSFPEMAGRALRQKAAYVMRGPLVLAKARVMGLCEKDVFAEGFANEDAAWQVTATAREDAPQDVWGAWNLTFAKGDERCTFPVCDLPSAAPSDDWHNAFSIWF